MAQRKPKALRPDGLVTVWNKEGEPVRVPRTVADRIANPPEGKTPAPFTLNPPKGKGKTETSEEAD